MTDSGEAPPERSIWYWIRHHLGWSLALLVLLTALAVALLRLAFPGLDYFRADLQRWAGDELGMSVTVDSIGAEWRGWRPVLRLDNVRLRDTEGRPLLRFDAILVDADPVASLRQWALRPDHLIIRGAHLTVERDAGGGFSVCCVDAAPTTTAAPPALWEWLRSESLLEIDDATVRFRDRAPGGATHTFTAIEAVLVNGPDGTRVRGHALLPASLGDRFTFAIDLAPGADGYPESARVYLEGHDLRLGATPLTRRLPAAVSIGGGSGDVRLWLDWQQGTVERASLEATTRSLAVAVQGHALPANSFDAGAVFHRDGSSGEWSVSGVIEGLAGGRLTTGGRTIRFELEGESADDLSRVALASAQAELSLFEPYLGALGHDLDLGWLQGLALRGEVRDLAMAFDPAAVARSLQLSARFTGLGWSRFGDIPGIAGLDGRLVAGAGRLHGVLPGSPLEVDATHLFREVLAADSVAGEIWLLPEADLWDLRIDGLELTNPDIELALSGAIHIPRAGGAPRLNLVGEFDHSRLDAVSRYLPAAIMADDAVRWLDRGLVSGRIHSGGLVVQGHIDGFPWDDGSGRLEARAQLEQGIIDYQRGWPRLEEVEAEAVFVGRAMTIHGSSAKLLGSTARDVQAHSPDLDAEDVLLTITGTVTGPAQDGMRVLLETPLRDRFEDHLGGATVSGEVVIDLALEILLDSEDVTLDGDIRFEGNQLTLPLLDVPLADTTGTLHITDVGLAGTGLTGSLDDIPVRLDVETIDDGTEDVTRVRLTGPLTPDVLARRGVPWAARAAGETTWEATVTMPNDLATGPPTRLAARSHLGGLALDLPPPLGKSATERRELSLSGALDSDDGRRRMDVQLGDDVRAVVVLDSRGERVRISRADVRIGPGPVDSSGSGGLFISGSLPVLDADGWVPRVAEVTGQEGSADGVALDFGGLDLSAGRLLALGHEFANARVVARGPRQGRLPVEVAAEGLEAKLEVPLDDPQAPVAGDIATLHLAGDDDDGESAEVLLDPRDIPPMEVTCADCRLGGLELGKVHLVTRPLPDGTAIDRLVTASDELEMDASGKWVMETPEQSRSLLKARLVTPDLGRFLQALGYRESGIAEGNAKARLEATWLGPPTAFSLARSTGELEIRIKNGRLEDVEPGAAGRFFGLLSINALPRRLLLDFRDLFTKGLSFDTIEGSFTIDNGDAYTNNLTMNSPSAQVDVAGRVGLATEDYDEIITVTPKVSSTLPVAGAIAGGPVGAAVGAAAAFISKSILGKEVGGAIKTQYSVTGSWADPKITKLGGDREGDADTDSVYVGEDELF